MEIKAVNLQLPIPVYKRMLVEKGRRMPRISINSLIVEACMEKYGMLDRQKAAGQ